MRTEPFWYRLMALGLAVLGQAIHVRAGIAIEPPTLGQPPDSHSPSSAGGDELPSEPGETPGPDSLDRDYSSQLPRIAPRSPAQAENSFHLAPGFGIQLVAAEPLVVDPVDLVFDEQARLYVVEMRGYSEDGDKNLGRIRLLTDTDKDGRFDTSSIFAEGLSWPTAIACFDGGVYVGAAPELRYYKDSDGDGNADVQKTIFTGFGRDNVQGLLNSFRFGWDNWIHVAVSTNGARLSSAAHPNHDPLPLRGRDFAFDPRNGEILATSGGGQNGQSIGPWGERFVCSNSDHIQLILIEDRYLARNPYVQAPPARVRIASDGPQADVFRTSPVEPWRIVRTRLRRQGLVPGPLERGGRAAGYFTGATGITVYLGNQWPSDLYGLALIADVGSNLVHRKRLIPDGIGYQAHRMDIQSELLTSDDIWFRPVQMANGPDGTLYIADMYRETIEHPLSLPPVIKQHLDLTSGRDRGRIWRVVAQGYRAEPLPDLSDCSTRQLVALLDHPNGWHRETAARMLYERQDRAAIAHLQTLARQGSRPESRARALYVLHGLSALTEDAVLHALLDPHPQVRRHAVRASEWIVEPSPRLEQALIHMTRDPEPVVRYQLALTLGERTNAPRARALVQLARRDSDNPYILAAVHSSLEAGAGYALKELISGPGFATAGAAQQFLAALTHQIVQQNRPDDMAELTSALRQLLADSDTRAADLLAILSPAVSEEVRRRILDQLGPSAETRMRQLFDELAAVVLDPGAPIGQRQLAVGRLRMAPADDAVPVLTHMLTPNQPPQLQRAALDTLAQFDSIQVPQLLIQRWRQLSPELQRRATDILVSRTAWHGAILDAIESKQLVLDPTFTQTLTQIADPSLAQRIRRSFQPTSDDRQTVVSAYQSALTLASNTQRGRLLFRQHCSGCHRLENYGHEIGPSLAAMRNRGPESILQNILAPNAEINPQYVNYLAVTTTGRTLTGVLVSESATSITLRRTENQTDTILRVDLEELTSTGRSLMPEGFEQQLSHQDLADVIAYILEAEAE